MRIEIEDDGRGVPDALAERIFLPLVSGRAEGSGLGLTLAQQVAREHAGSLAYRSRPGHTVFRLLAADRLISGGFAWDSTSSPRTGEAGTSHGEAAASVLRHRC